MSQIAYANPTAGPPDLSAVPAAPPPDSPRRSGPGLVAAPALISLGVHLVFFLAYWVPETSTFPERTWWLTQLSPLASAALTSAGHAQVSAQDVQSGLPGLLLLVFGVALWLLTRTPHWMGRFATAVPVLGGLLVCLGTWVAYAVSAHATCPGLASVLMTGWLAAAAYGAYRGLLSPPPERMAKTRRSGLPLLAAYALVGPLPTAVGRCLFGSELRDVAAGLQGNTTAGRLAGLATGATVGLYLCGVLAGVGVWLVYQCWPLGTFRRPGRRRVVALLVALALTGVVSWPTMTAAARRSTTLMYASPAAEVSFGCASRVLEPVGRRNEIRPAETLVVTGLGCRTVTFFSGYRQISSRTLTVGLSTSARPASGQFGSTVVVVQSKRLDGRPTQLTALHAPDGALQWEYGCPDRIRMGVEFDEPGSSVVVECGESALTFDPQSGPGR